MVSPPNYHPDHCSRCDVRLPERTESGRCLCDDCFGQTYDLEHRRANGAHRVRLKPCSLCGGPKERMCADSADPWETGVDVTDGEGPRAPAVPSLDLSDPRDDVPPPDHVAYALS